jgi:hypothetical protein
MGLLPSTTTRDNSSTSGTPLGRLPVENTDTGRPRCAAPARRSGVASPESTHPQVMADQERSPVLTALPPSGVSSRGGPREPRRRRRAGGGADAGEEESTGREEAAANRGRTKVRVWGRRGGIMCGAGWWEGVDAKVFRGYCVKTQFSLLCL